MYLYIFVIFFNATTDVIVAGIIIINNVIINITEHRPHNGQVTKGRLVVQSSLNTGTFVS